MIDKRAIVSSDASSTPVSPTVSPFSALSGPPKSQTADPKPDRRPTAYTELEDLQTDDYKILKTPRRRSKLPRTITVVASIALLAMLVGLLPFVTRLPHWLRIEIPAEQPEEGVEATNRQPKSQRPTRPTAGAPATSASMGDQSPNGSELPSARSERPDVLPPERSQQMAEPVQRPAYRSRDLEYYSKKQLDDCWLTVKPYLIELKIENDVGTHRATGTIIDSRGWVATSYRAVLDATKVEVFELTGKASPKGGDQDRLSDLVRGVIAADPSRDLVILSINRRFVLSVAEIQIPEVDRIVASQYLVQSQAPAPGISECRIADRAAFVELPPESQSWLKQAGLEDASTQYMVHTNDQPNGSGAPLFTIDGQLVGLNIHRDANRRPPGGEVLAVPASYLRSLASNAEDQPKPLSSLAPIEPEEQQTTKMNSLGPAHPSRKLSVELNQSGQQCQAFGWWPTNQQQFLEMQRFVRRAIVVNDTLEWDNPDESTKDVLQRQLDHWLARANAILQPANPIDEARKSEFNKFSVEQLNNNQQYFIAFAKIRFGAIDSPVLDGQDTVTFELVGSNRLIIAPLDNDWPVLRPDTECLVIGLSQKQRLKITDTDGQTSNAQKADIPFAISN